jgi:hypothetical protein
MYPIYALPKDDIIDEAFNAIDAGHPKPKEHTAVASDSAIVAESLKIMDEAHNDATAVNFGINPIHSHQVVITVRDNKVSGIFGLPDDTEVLALYRECSVNFKGANDDGTVMVDGESSFVEQVIVMENDEIVECAVDAYWGSDGGDGGDDSDEDDDNDGDGSDDFPGPR